MRVVAAALACVLTHMGPLVCELSCAPARHATAHLEQPAQVEGGSHHMPGMSHHMAGTEEGDPSALEAPGHPLLGAGNTGCTPFGAQIPSVVRQDASRSLLEAVGGSMTASVPALSHIGRARPLDAPAASLLLHSPPIVPLRI